MSKQSQTLLLADNFPAKAYLLLTHLTDAAPSVASFSADGTAFEIYDQNVFAQRYLPQFFKHANYGSFVRQLNLYGFTSSRLEGNNDVVVWHHACFQRDHQALLKDMKRKDMKRAKKTKSAKPAHGLPPVAVRIRTPSSSDEASVPSHAPKPVDVDRDWLEAEFIKIADQNKFLETKLAEQNKLLETRLEALLQLTLRITPASSFADVELGGKRCRMSPMESDPAVRHQSGFVHEETKVCDDDHCGSEHAGENYEIEPAAYRGGGGDGDSSQLNSSMAAAVGTSEPRTSDSSLKKFIDLMLNEEEQEECRPEEVHDHDNTSIKSHAVSPDSEPIRPNDNNISLQDCASCDSVMGDELMEEDFETLVPETAIDVNRDLFAVDDEVGEPSAPPSSDEHLVTMANCAVDKTEGPEPVPSSAPNVPLLGRGDLEAGHLPVGVTIVAAHAELIEDGDAEGERHAERPREWRDRRKIVYLLAFIGVVLAIGVTVTSVHFSRKKEAVMTLMKDVDRPCKKTNSCKAAKEVELTPYDDAREAEFEAHNDALVSSVEGWRSYGARTSSKAYKSKATKSKTKTTKRVPEEWSKRSETPEHGQNSRASLFDVGREDRFSSFNLTLGETDFVCNLNS